ncbi:SAV_915 family protein [Actinoplanes xinjiangensis]|uniref:SAV_915 family protein n=1 Tax=Actinoplanes xinjiangensis TaxID=512350 RepID=UPI00341BFF90
MSDHSETGTLDAERVQRGAADPAHIFPPIVYVPLQPTPPGAVQNDQEMTIELRQTRDGRLALLVYSAMDRLIDHCGPAQPWTILATQDLEKVALATGFDLVLLDLDIPRELRHTGEAI